VTERELERRAQRRLKALRHVEEVSHNVAATCRFYRVGRQCCYSWLRPPMKPTAWSGLKDHCSRTGSHGDPS
jgi:hypothetical protein